MAAYRTLGYVSPPVLYFTSKNLTAFQEHSFLSVNRISGVVIFWGCSVLREKCDFRKVLPPLFSGKIAPLSYVKFKGVSETNFG